VPVYTLISGSATDTQDLANKLDVFLVDILGWVRWRTITSGVSDVDRVYHNDGGESSGLYGHIYARFRGYSGQLDQYGYSFYEYDGSSSTGVIGGGSESSNPGATVTGCNYRFFGNKDIVWSVLHNLGADEYFSSAVGYSDTPYCSTYDDYPLMIIGQAVDTDKFSNDRVLMYNSVSGTAFYHSEDYSGLVKYGAPQSRDSSYFGEPPVLVNDAAESYELRGTVPGAQQVWGGNFASGDFVVVSGTGNYLVIKHGGLDANTFAYGPVNEAL